MRMSVSRSRLRLLAALLFAGAVAACGGSGGGGGGGGQFLLAIGDSDLVTDGTGTAQTLVRVARSGYDGPVAISLGADAPVDLTADPLTIASGATAGTLVLHKGPSTPLGGPTRFSIVGSGGGLVDDALIELLVTGPSGSLDESFGSGGIVTLSFGADASAEALLETTDDSLVVGGRASGDFAMARIDEAGVPIATFGSAGFASVDFAGGDDAAYGLARQFDGSLVLAGTAATNGGFAMALARFTADGELDATFGGDGKVVTASAGAQGVLRSIVQQDDGKLIAAGTAMVGSSFTFTLVRYESNGALDTTFGGGDGIVQRALGDGDAEAFDVTVREDGLLIAGGFLMEAGERHWVVVFFEPDGTSIGPTTTGDVDGGTAHAVTWSQGGFVAAGTQGAGGEAFIAGLGLDGELAPGFGGGDGVVTFAGPGADMAVQADGRIVIGGGLAGDFLISRATPAGGADSTWGDGGTLIADLGGDEAVHVLYVSRDTRLIAAGSLDGAMAIARFWP